MYGGFTCDNHLFLYEKADNFKGYLKSRWTNTMLFCTHLDAFCYANSKCVNDEFKSLIFEKVINFI